MPQAIRYRPISAEDLDACADLVIAEGSIPWTRGREKFLIGAWRALLDERRLIAIVWEDIAASATARLLGVGMTLMVPDAFADALAREPRAYPAVEIYQSLETDRPLVLSAREIARANATDGVNLFTLHNPLRERDLSSPMNAALLPLGPAAWFACHAGYNVRSILWEVYGPAHAAYLEGGGFVVRGADGRKAPGKVWDADDRTPFLCGLARSDRPNAAYDAQQLFLLRSPRPTLGFTPAQQRLLAHSMFGLTDREIGAALGLAQNTIKRLWRDIFERAGELVPALFGNAAGGNGHPRERHDARGTQKRHLLINFLRQNMHELRPYERARPAATRRTPRAGPARDQERDR